MKRLEQSPEDKTAAMVTYHATAKPDHAALVLHRHRHKTKLGLLPSQSCTEPDCIIGIAMLNVDHLTEMLTVLTTARDSGVNQPPSSGH